MAAEGSADVQAFASSSSRPRDGEGVLHYYIAVDRPQFKMGTLVDLLEVLGRRARLPLAVCCSGRDSLDAVCATVAASDQFSLSFLHSDLGEVERATVLNSFRCAMSEWKYVKLEGTAAVKNQEKGESKSRSHLLVMTDTCLPSHALGEAFLFARLMINYDLPSKKEAYMRRMAVCLGVPATATGVVPANNRASVNNSISNPSGNSGSSGGIIINVIVGSEVSILRNLEESCGIVIDEMPIHISELI